MKAKAEIDAGVCGFKTVAVVTCEDAQHVKVEIDSGCEKVRAMGALLKDKGPIDAFGEITPKGRSVILGAAREVKPELVGVAQRQFEHRARAIAHLGIEFHNTILLLRCL